MSLHEQVIIIGGGPSGAACAIQLKRYGYNPLLLEKDSIGGLVKNAWRIDNYPGYPEGINGVELAGKIKTHLKRFEVRTLNFELRTLKYVDDYFVLEGGSETYRCKYLVVASGTRPKKVYAEMSEDVSDKVFYEVFPLRGIENKAVAIIGAGDAAFDYAMTLSEKNHVHIFNRGTEIKCIPALVDIVNEQSNVSYAEEMELQSVELKGDKLLMDFRKSNISVPYSADYIIFAAGREPELSFLSPEIENMQEQLEQEGLLYIIGDVKNGMVRQASVAIGDGIKAAMAIREKMISG